MTSFCESFDEVKHKIIYDNLILNNSITSNTITFAYNLAEQTHSSKHVFGEKMQNFIDKTLRINN